MNFNNPELDVISSNNSTLNTSNNSLPRESVLSNFDPLFGPVTNTSEIPESNQIASVPPSSFLISPIKNTTTTGAGQKNKFNNKRKNDKFTSDKNFKTISEEQPLVSLNQTVTLPEKINQTFDSTFCQTENSSVSLSSPTSNLKNSKQSKEEVSINFYFI